MSMHGLKKTGITLVTGAFVGAVASTALGGELVGVGDYGNYTAPNLDGISDRILVTGTNVEFIYCQANGLNVSDTSGQLVEIIVGGDGGSGYGNGNVSAPIGVGPHPAGGVYIHTPPVGLNAGFDQQAPGWYVLGTVNNNGTGGVNATFTYQLDGPAGGYFYEPGAAFVETNMIRIDGGGTGYMPGNTNTSITARNLNSENALLLNIAAPAGGNIGTFGVPGNQSISARTPASVLNPAFIFAGTDVNALLADNSGAASTDFWVLNDNASAGQAKRAGSYGNWRLYLGHTSPPANGNMERLSDAYGSVAGNIANLAITANSTPTNPTNTNATSGIGYTAGNFTIYDGNGDTVTDYVIAYEVDATGRIYADHKGSFYPGTGNVNVAAATNGPTAGAIAGDLNCTSGWTITTNNTSALDTSGWTIKPQGNGFGFECTAVELYGQIVSLPAMGCNTNGANAWDVASVPTLSWNANGSATTQNANAAAAWSYTASAVPTGTVIDTTVLTNGQSYATSTTSWLTTTAGDTGTGATFEGVIGAVGRRYVSEADGTMLEVDLAAAGYECYANGDFNGDGYSDLLWHSPTYGLTAIWNMGDDARLGNFGVLPDVGTEWQLAGIGKMGFAGTGCCLFWWNSLTGETAVWVINTTSSDSDDWVTLADLSVPVGDTGVAPTVTNNSVQNSGNSVYWYTEAGGAFYYWPMSVDSATAGTSWVGGGAAALSLDGADISLPAGWYVVGAGNLAGRPSADSNTIRDLVVTGDNYTALWLMGSNGSAIDTSGVDGGGGFVTMGGADVVQGYGFAGVGQYLVNAAYTSNVAALGIPFGVNRNTWFANLHWSLPGYGASYSWMMDRNIDLYDFSGVTTTGTGISVDPYAIVGSTATSN